MSEFASILEDFIKSITNKSRNDVDRNLERGVKWIQGTKQSSFSVGENFNDSDDARFLKELLDKCNHNAQLSYELALFLDMLNKKFVDKELKNTDAHLFLTQLKYFLDESRRNNLKDFKLYDLSFLFIPLKKEAQSVLGKEKKSGKEYPNVLAGRLATMRLIYFDSDKEVPYFTSEDKKEYKVKKGKLLKRDCDDDKMKDGSYFYALSPKGGLYAINPFENQGIDHFHHSTFRAGQPVISAGFLIVKNGKIIKINANSGHYQPSARQLILAAMILKHQKLIDDKCIIDIFDDKVKLSLEEILSNDKYSDIVKKILDENPRFKKESLSLSSSEKELIPSELEKSKTIFSKVVNSALPVEKKPMQHARPLSLSEAAKPKLVDIQETSNIDDTWLKLKTAIQSVKLQGNEGYFTKNALKKLNDCLNDWDGRDHGKGLEKLKDMARTMDNAKPPVRQIADDILSIRLPEPEKKSVQQSRPLARIPAKEAVKPKPIIKSTIHSLPVEPKSEERPPASAAPARVEHPSPSPAVPARTAQRPPLPAAPTRGRPLPAPPPVQGGHARPLPVVPARSESPAKQKTAEPAHSPLPETAKPKPTNIHETTHVDDTWLTFKTKIQSVILPQNEGYLTKGALEKLKTCINDWDKKDHREGLEKLQAMAKTIRNAKSPVSEIVNEIALIKVPPPKKGGLQKKSN